MNRSCNKATELVSESMEHRLSFRDRLRLWLHLRACRLCRGFARDQEDLRRAIRMQRSSLEQDVGGCGEGLSDEARSRLERFVRDSLPGRS